jgi:ATP-dependent Lhr-like helicase
MPEAVELLRKIRKQPRDGKLVQVSGCDPCNLTGIVLPGTRVPALRTYEVTLRDGLVVSESEQAEGA